MAASLPTLPQGDILQSLLAGPAGPPPPGHVSDLDALNPYRGSIMAVIIIGLFGAIAFPVMRLFTQHVVSRGLVAEDYVMLAALFFQMGNSILSPMIVHAGIGKHMWNISAEQFFRASELTWLFVSFYYVAVTLVKVAILLQFIRIFGINKQTRWVCWACIFINVAVYLPSVFLNIFECTPVSAAWNRAKPGRCIDVALLYKFTGIFNIISDFTILAIPVPVVAKLNMSAKKKLLVMAVFATGIIPCVASILRAYYTFRAFETRDLSFNLLWMGVFCTFEVVFGMIIFFMPVAAVLYNYIKTKVFAASPTTMSSISAWERCPGDNVERGPVGKGGYNKNTIGGSGGSYGSGSTGRKKTRETYEMPSLASFEEREIGDEERGVDEAMMMQRQQQQSKRMSLGTVEYLSSGSGSSSKSKMYSSSSDRSLP